MRTFYEFLENIKIERIYKEINEEAERNNLLRQMLLDEGWWDTMKAAGQGAWNFLKGTGRDIAQQAKGAWSSVTGPATQLTHALAALTNAKQTIDRTPELAKSQTTGDPAAGFPSMPLTDWLASMIKQLQSQSSQMKNMSVTGAQANYGGPSQPTTGAQVGTATTTSHGPGPGP